jgi:hypothetical protein
MNEELTYQGVVYTMEPDGVILTAAMQQDIRRQVEAMESHDD